MSAGGGSTSLAAALVATLVASQHEDGGWGAEPGKRSNTEATALAVLALAAANDPAATARVRRGMAWLVARQRADGAWSLSTKGEEPSWATSLAVLALLDEPQHGEIAVRGLRWLLGARTRRIGLVASLLFRFWPSALPIRMDPHLRGWAWSDGAFSWVEPTAYALLALKRGRALLGPGEADARVDEAERMIYDRACAGGGWNYGNSSVYQVPVPPYPEVTAIALVALQDRADAEPVRAGLAALERLLEGTGSGWALGWSILGLALHGRDTAALEAGLARAWERTRFLGATRTVAVGLLAAAGRQAVAL